MGLQAFRPFSACSEWAPLLVSAQMAASSSSEFWKPPGGTAGPCGKGDGAKVDYAPLPQDGEVVHSASTSPDQVTVAAQDFEGNVALDAVAKDTYVLTHLVTFEQVSVTVSECELAFDSAGSAGMVVGVGQDGQPICRELEGLFTQEVFQSEGGELFIRLR
eukprot:11041917-Alexandrium_andersonii.AAC.1